MVVAACARFVEYDFLKRQEPDLMRCRRMLIWIGRVIATVFVVALVVYVFRVGLEDAVSLSSVIGALAAVAAVIAPYLVPTPHPPGVPVPGESDTGVPPSGPDLRRANGVQINHGGTNSQTNHFTS